MRCRKWKNILINWLFLLRGPTIYSPITCLVHCNVQLEKPTLKKTQISYRNLKSISIETLRDDLSQSALCKDMLSSMQSQRPCSLLQRHPRVNTESACFPDYEISDKTTNRALVQRQNQGRKIRTSSRRKKVEENETRMRPSSLWSKEKSGNIWDEESSLRVLYELYSR